MVDGDPDEGEELRVPRLDVAGHEDRVGRDAVLLHAVLDELDPEVDVPAHLDRTAERNLAIALAEVQIAAGQLRLWHVHRVEHPRPRVKFLMSWLPPFSRAGTVLAPSCAMRFATSPLALPPRLLLAKAGRPKGGTRFGSVSMSACSRRFHLASSSADGAVPNSPG